MKPKKLQIEFARSLIADFVGCGFLDKGPDWVETWSNFSLRWSDGPFGAKTDPATKAYVTIPDQMVDAFVARARKSEPALEALMFLVGTRLRAGESIPAQISELAGEHLVHGLEFPPSHKPPRHWGRNYIIYHTMRDLVFRYGIAPTRASNSRGIRDIQPSASEIVASASQKSELPSVSYSTSQKIWTDENNRSMSDENGPPQYHPSLHMVDLLDDPEEWVRV